MRTIIICILFFGNIFANDSPLSKEKAELLKIQKKQIEQELKQNEKSWISSLNLSLSIDENRDQINNNSQTKKGSIAWNQDIFKSGGIYYTIDKAKALSEVNLYEINLQEALYLKQIYTLKAQIQKDALKQEQNNLILKNQEIDLFIITEKYKIGSSDISELNRVSIDRDSAKTQTLIDKNTLENEKFELKKLIGDTNINDVALIEFELISKDLYLNSNLELLQYNKKNVYNNANLKVIQSSYLPKLTFNGEIGYSEYKSDILDYDGNNYGYGLTLSIPLDINTKSTIESAKLQYMQTRVSAIDRKLELEQEYAKHVQTINDIKEKIIIANNTHEMYSKLYDFTKNQVDAGFKSTYALESLANSVKIQKIEIEIQNYNIIIEKIALYFAVKH